ncbi:MAG: hypothetical protein JSV62_03750 [Promethearchaeota archaeon]|nr:MAG: hypothetical protein JSV62_03750 [Candidatus Lokiarchaeota archaeon]
MYEKSEAVIRARKELIQQAYDEICEEKEFDRLKSKVYCVLGKFWLHIIAQKEGLFNSEEWNSPNCRDSILKMIKRFLTKHIK